MENLVQNRIREIRKLTPDCLENLFEMQNRLCDLCGHPIQDLILAHLDHSIPVVRYVRALDIEIGDAARECNHPDNLRAVHSSCNLAKNDMTRDEWYQQKLNFREIPRFYTKEELAKIIQGNVAGGRTQGIRNVHNGHLKRARSKINRKRQIEIMKVVAAKGVAEQKGIFNPNYDRSKGGRIAGLIMGPRHFKNGTGLFSLSKEQRLRAAKKGGQIGCHKRWGHIGAVENCKLCNRTMDERRAAHNVATKKHKDRIKVLKTSEELQSIFKNNGKVSGKKAVESGLIYFAGHSRWHTNRGIVKSSCSFCREKLNG